MYLDAVENGRPASIIHTSQQILDYVSDFTGLHRNADGLNYNSISDYIRKHLEAQYIRISLDVPPAFRLGVRSLTSFQLKNGLGGFAEFLLTHIINFCCYIYSEKIIVSWRELIEYSIKKTQTR